MEFIKINKSITNKHYSRLAEISELEIPRELSELAESGVGLKNIVVGYLFLISTLPIQSY